ncbi:hypothetical protein PAEPH01_2318 [Pancytospora epiphaga]|nr:hypothetical protein PAEPH01_2318 [Pancytospora epiphaga]
MVLRETLESVHEAELEIQRCISRMKTQIYGADKELEQGRHIKAYKKELELETELKWLSDFLQRQKREVEEELEASKVEINKEMLRIRCKQIEDMFNQVDDDDNEDFGEE